MAIGHLLATLASRIESVPPDLDPPRRRSALTAHLSAMTTHTTPRDLCEPVLTLAELAGYLSVPVQTLGDLRTEGRVPHSVNQLIVSFFMIGRMSDGTYQLPIIVWPASAARE
jgi:hypothetical protein